MQSTFPAEAALSNGVSLYTESLNSISTPASTIMQTISRNPNTHAAWMGVSPHFSVDAFSLIKYLTHSTRFLIVARKIGMARVFHCGDQHLH